MQLVQTTSHQERNQKILKKMLSPFCGLVTEVARLSNESSGSQIMTFGANLCGVHRLLGRPDPGRGGYHIGGGGLYRGEAMIKTLAEAIERYSQLLSLPQQKKYQTCFCSYEDLDTAVAKRVDVSLLSLFETLCGPFEVFDAQMQLSWIALPCLVEKKLFWAPLQMLLIGYHPRVGEKRFAPAVTTGTAVHTSYTNSVKNSLLELLQLHSAMGHWYSKTPAIEIAFDDRLDDLKRICLRTLKGSKRLPKFYLLPSVQIDSFNVVCVFEEEKCLPKVALGLGSDVVLEKAMYKAYLEASCVVSLARMLLYRYCFEGEGAKTMFQALEQKMEEFNSFQDLDSNVALFGYHPKAFEWYQSRFGGSQTVFAKDLPADWNESSQQTVERMLSAAQNLGIQLLGMNLTGCEADAFGFKVSRVWSPQLLGLCMPGSVSKAHPAWRSFGGVDHEFPHPYP